MRQKKRFQRSGKMPMEDIKILDSGVGKMPVEAEFHPCPKCNRCILGEDVSWAPTQYTWWELEDRWSIAISCNCGFRALAWSRQSKEKALEFAIAQWDKNVYSY